ncbi:sensor domain-containing protein [Deinococcus cellulosilyticus]|uniref:Histidine kinase n=1 Tax=Deinococcus cellulosilyticus (strain DSM 18568 / NBRC 106333 / KACC 11606 / 5516J-15) TaxID=1223518 RepID=A0A511N0X3_DEIC1|nr:sensor domain-containing protein [Deinococcus cellulosilyticus]GEM46098.1 histidine kinase [Deinococcus cellulosilyticus NBRC 106333 = KACC 11606]
MMTVQPTSESGPGKLPGYFAELFSAVTYRRLFYLIATFPLGILYFVVLVTGFSLGLGLLVLVVGFPLFMATVWCILRFADTERALATLLGQKLYREKPIIQASGFMNWAKATLSDAGTYKALLYALLKFPLGIASFVIVVTFLAISLGFLLLPVSQLFYPLPLYFGDVEIQLNPLGWVIWEVVAVGVTVLSLSLLNLLAEGWMLLNQALLTDYGEAKHAQREVQALKQTSSAVAYSGSLDDTLSHIAGQGMEALGASALAVTIKEGASWRMGASRNIPETFARAFSEARPRLSLPDTLPQGRAHIEKHYRAAWEKDVLIEPLIRELPDGSLVTVPMMYQSQQLGQLHAFYRRGVAPTQRELEFLAALADQGAVAIETSQLIDRVQAQASQQERQRLARELHDSVAQALYGITLGAKTAKGWLERDPQKVKESLDYAIQLAEGGTAEMKALLFSLREDALDEGGLCEALARLAHAMKVRYGLTIHTELPEEPQLSAVKKHAVYRIAQEATHNAVKHARATEMSMVLRQTDLGWEMDIQDNGKGFDLAEIAGGTLGLKSMRERAEFLAGSITVSSHPGQGTRIHLEFPH